MANMLRNGRLSSAFYVLTTHGIAAGLQALLDMQPAPLSAPSAVWTSPCSLAQAPLRGTRTDQSSRAQVYCFFVCSFCFNIEATVIVSKICSSAQ